MGGYRDRFSDRRHSFWRAQCLCRMSRRSRRRVSLEPRTGVWRAHARLGDVDARRADHRDSARSTRPADRTAWRCNHYGAWLYHQRDDAYHFRVLSWHGNFHGRWVRGAADDVSSHLPFQLVYSQARHGHRNRGVRNRVGDTFSRTLDAVADRYIRLARGVFYPCGYVGDCDRAFELFFPTPATGRDESQTRFRQLAGAAIGTREGCGL